MIFVISVGRVSGISSRKTGLLAMSNFSFLTSTGSMHDHGNLKSQELTRFATLLLCGDIDMYVAHARTFVCAYSYYPHAFTW